MRKTLKKVLGRQRLPLTTHVETLQDEVEYRVQRQFWLWAPGANEKMGKDNVLKLQQRQTRLYPLPMLTIAHFSRQK